MKRILDEKQKANKFPRASLLHVYRKVVMSRRIEGRSSLGKSKFSAKPDHLLVFSLRAVAWSKQARVELHVPALAWYDKKVSCDGQPNAAIPPL